MEMEIGVLSVCQGLVLVGLFVLLLTCFWRCWCGSGTSLGHLVFRASKMALVFRLALLAPMSGVTDSDNRATVLVSLYELL